MTSLLLHLQHVNAERLLQLSDLMLLSVADRSVNAEVSLRVRKIALNRQSLTKYRSHAVRIVLLTVSVFYCCNGSLSHRAAASH